MIIKNVNLKNYCAIKNADITFHPGINIISGSNGQGKSHVIRAIAYLLLNYNKGKIEDDCNWDEDSFSVFGEISHNGKDYKIQNSFTRKSGVSKELEVVSGDHSKIYDSNKEVTETLAEVFNPSYCKPAIVSFQGEMDIVSAKPAERREYLKKIYDLDFKSEITQLESERDSLNEKKTQLEISINGLELKSYDVQLLEELSLTEEQYEEKKKEISLLEERMKNIELQIKLYKSAVSTLDEKIKLKDNYDKMLKEAEEMISSYEKKIIELEEKKNNTTEITDEIEKLKEELENINLIRIKPFDQEALDNAKEVRSEIKSSIKHAEEHLSLIDQGKCPTCGHEFVDADKKKYQIEIFELETQLEDIETMINVFNESKKEHEESVKLNNQNKLKKQELSSKIQLKEQELTNFISSINKDIEYNKEKSKSSFTLLESHKKNSLKMEEEISELEKNLPEEPEKITSDNINELEQLEKEVNQYETSVEKNKWIKEQNEKTLKQKQEDEKKTSELNFQLDNIVKELSIYKSAIEILKKNFPNYIINSMKEELEQGMNDLLELAYDGKYNVSIRENKSGLIITYGKKNQDINLASGAETNIFNIGFKNSFNQIAGLGVLILDEALNFADDNIAKNVFESISQMIEKNKLSQVFIITHKEKIKETLISDYDAHVYEVKNGEISLLEN